MKIIKVNEVDPKVGQGLVQSLLGIFGASVNSHLSRGSSQYHSELGSQEYRGTLVSAL